METATNETRQVSQLIPLEDHDLEAVDPRDEQIALRLPSVPLKGTSGIMTAVEAGRVIKRISEEMAAVKPVEVDLNMADFEPEPPATPVHRASTPMLEELRTLPSLWVPAKWFLGTCTALVLVVGCGFRIQSALHSAPTATEEVADVVAAGPDAGIPELTTVTVATHTDADQKFEQPTRKVEPFEPKAPAISVPLHRICMSEEPNNEDHVKWAQWALGKVLGETIVVDGKFGPATTEAYRKFWFQHMGQTPIDRGDIGRPTLSALELALTKGESHAQNFATNLVAKREERRLARADRELAKAQTPSVPANTSAANAETSRGMSTLAAYLEQQRLQKYGLSDSPTLRAQRIAELTHNTATTTCDADDDRCPAQHKAGNRRGRMAPIAVLDR